MDRINDSVKREWNDDVGKKIAEKCDRSISTLEYEINGALNDVSGLPRKQCPNYRPRNSEIDAIVSKAQSIR